MAAKQDPVSGLNYGWTLGEDGWNVGMDSNLIKLGATINIRVLGFVSTPSVSTNGTRYIVASGSGAFTGQNNKLAVRVEDVWTFYTLPEGCIVYDEDTNAHYKFEGGSYSLLVNLSDYLTISSASSTYQTQTGMSSYLTISSASSTYQTQSGMSSYLTTSSASSTYATITQAKTECLTVACSDETTALSTGTSKITFRMPYAMTLTSVRASLSTAQTSGSIFTVDINESGSSVLSTKLTIDNTEKTSTTAAAAPVISDGNLADDAEITIDIDQVGDGTAKGLKLTLIGTRA